MYQKVEFETDVELPHQGICATRPRSRDHHVVILADWDSLPYEFSHPGNGLQAALLNADASEMAVGLLQARAGELDTLVIDEDFFGSPEATADACTQLRRIMPDLRIIAIATEIWGHGAQQNTSILEMLGLCNATLPSQACQHRVLAALPTTQATQH